MAHNSLVHTRTMEPKNNAAETRPVSLIASIGGDCAVVNTPPSGKNNQVAIYDINFSLNKYIFSDSFCPFSTLAD
jgi:hypothetical protein